MSIRSTDTPGRFFEQAAQAILRQTTSARTRTTRTSTVDVFLLPNATLRRLKQERLGRDVPFVNVLSFPEPEGFPRPDKPWSLGEIYLNRVYARPTSRAEGVRMLIHGILHLRGYRHDHKRDTITMERLEERLLARVQIEKRGIRFRPARSGRSQ